MKPIDKAPNAPRGHLIGTGWPAWRYGPNGEAEVFATEADVPEGWVDHMSKVGKPVVNATEPTVNDNPTDEPGLSRIEVMAALRAKGIKFKPTLSTELLRECLAEAEAAE